MINKSPLLFPCSSVGYQFSSTLSENSKGSGVNCSFLIVTTSRWYPVVFSSSCNFPLIAPYQPCSKYRRRPRYKKRKERGPRERQTRRRSQRRTRGTSRQGRQGQPKSASHREGFLPGPGFVLLLVLSLSPGPVPSSVG